MLRVAHVVAELQEYKEEVDILLGLIINEENWKHLANLKALQVKESNTTEILWRVKTGIRK